MSLEKYGNEEVVDNIGSEFCVFGSITCNPKLRERREGSTSTYQDIFSCKLQ